MLKRNCVPNIFSFSLEEHLNENTGVHKVYENQLNPAYILSSAGQIRIAKEFRLYMGKLGPKLGKAA